MGLELFRLHILTPSNIEKRLLDGLLLLISRERKQETVDRSLLKNLLRMLSNLQVYVFIGGVDIYEHSKAIKLKLVATCN